MVGELTEGVEELEWVGGWVGGLGRGRKGGSNELLQARGCVGEWMEKGRL